MTDAPGPTSVIDATILSLDPTAGGRLVELTVPPGLPALKPGFGHWVDAFGNLWARGDAGDPTNSVLDVVSGQVTDFGTSLLVGRAAVDGANGTVGERVLAPDGTVVWQARDEGGELVFDSFDIVAMAPGGKPRIIGESTVDMDGLAFSAPGDGNYVTVAGARAWWVDGDARTDAATGTGYKQYASIYSAPLDGSAPQQVTFASARFPAVDRCAPAGVTRLTYVVDSTSTGLADKLPEIHAATLDATGTVADDSVIWRGTEATSWVNSVGVCGDLIAVGYTLPDSAGEAGNGPREVLIGDAAGSTTILLGDAFGSAGRVTATPRGVFFFQWGEFKQFFWSRSSREAYFIGPGTSFAFGVASDGSVVTQAGGFDEVAGEDLPTVARRLEVVGD